MATVRLPQGALGVLCKLSKIWQRHCVCGAGQVSDASHERYCIFSGNVASTDGQGWPSDASSQYRGSECMCNMMVLSEQEDMKLPQDLNSVKLYIIILQLRNRVVLPVAFSLLKELRLRWLLLMELLETIRPGHPSRVTPTYC